MENGVRRIEQAMLHALLRRVDPRSLTKRELLLMVDLLGAALAVVDASTDLGQEFLGR